jgi:flavin-dependent dehydrogenase
MTSGHYDVVVAGASFAGLVVATSVGGRVALIDKGEVGEGQTSACGTTLDVVQKLGLEASIEEVHEWAVMHTRRGAHRFRLPYPFCTFDYRRFCRLLLERFSGDLIRASALGVERGAVATDQGPVAGRVLVDATGWRAVLARSVEPDFPAQAEITYGLEKAARGFDGEGLHFWFDSKVRGDGYGWSFPAGPTARAGVLSYIAPDGVKDSTEVFLGREGMAGGHYHGGFLTAGLRAATAGDVFLVGDAAGHCLPLTGEGIRPAVFFGQRLAGIIDQHLSGVISLPLALDVYRAQQAQYRRPYWFLRQAQTVLRGWPDPPVGTYLAAFSRGFMYSWVCRKYWEVAAPILRAAGAPAGDVSLRPSAEGGTAPDAAPAADVAHEVAARDRLEVPA